MPDPKQDNKTQVTDELRETMSNSTHGKEHLKKIDDAVDKLGDTGIFKIGKIRVLPSVVKRYKEDNEPED